MCGLLIKCAALVVMIHGFRALGRLAGPRRSALALGLPSTTAIVLLICGVERGAVAAAAMAESSLFGLVGAVALPLVYAQAVRLGWRLPAALAVATGGYLLVALALGCLPAVGFSPRLGLAFIAILSAASWARGLPIPEDRRASVSLSIFQVIAVRTAIPATYALVLGVVQRQAGPGWAGLVSTFPSMSLVVLAVTHLEAGPGEASRIARALPAGNTGTLAFLAAFQIASTKIGLAGGTIAGYAAALTALLIIERHDRIVSFICLRSAQSAEIWRTQVVPRSLAIQAQYHVGLIASIAHPPRAPRYLVHKRPRHRVRFAPRVETLAW